MVLIGVRIDIFCNHDNKYLQGSQVLCIDMRHEANRCEHADEGRSPSCENNLFPSRFATFLIDKGESLPYLYAGFLVGVAQLVERWIVAPVVEGSNPFTHPI